MGRTESPTEHIRNAIHLCICNVKAYMNTLHFIHTPPGGMVFPSEEPWSLVWEVSYYLRSYKIHSVKVSVEDFALAFLLPLRAEEQSLNLAATRVGQMSCYDIDNLRTFIPKAPALCMCL